MLRFPPKKILVAFDMSPVSMDAWRHAQRWARRFKAEVEAVYVAEWLSQEGVRGSGLTPSLRSALLKHIRGSLGASAKVHIFEGDPVVTLLRLARTRRPDLIVMGTHGRTGFDRILFGSVAEAMVRLSPVPVLAVKGKPKLIKSVLAPVNFTGYAQAGLFFAAAAAAAMKAQLNVSHLYTDPERFGNPRFLLTGMLEKLPEDLRRRCRPEIETVQAEATEGIVAQASQHGLVVLVAHRKSLLKDWLMGTTVERVLRHAPVPVLSLPAPKAAFAVGQWRSGRAVSGWVA